MYYRTQDQEYIERLRKIVIEDSKNPSAWKSIYNQLYIDDMMSHLRSISTSNIIPGTGNYDPNVAIVTYNGSIIADIKTHMRSLGLPIENIWITPVIKSLSIGKDCTDCENISLKYLTMELLRLDPEYILIVCDAALMNTINPIALCKPQGNRIYVSTTNLEDSLNIAFKSCKLM